jgi:hypothetical protein
MYSHFSLVIGELTCSIGLYHRNIRDGDGERICNIITLYKKLMGCIRLDYH